MLPWAKTQKFLGGVLGGIFWFLFANLNSGKPTWQRTNHHFEWYLPGKMWILQGYSSQEFGPWCTWKDSEIRDSLETHHSFKWTSCLLGGMVCEFNGGHPKLLLKSPAAELIRLTLVMAPACKWLTREEVVKTKGFLGVLGVWYCWWQPEIRPSPVDSGSLSHYLQRVFLHPRWLFSKIHIFKGLTGVWVL